jgi:hypothetical protein
VKHGRIARGVDMIPGYESSLASVARGYGVSAEKRTSGAPHAEK